MRKIFYKSDNSRDEIKSLSQINNNSVDSDEIFKIISTVKNKGDAALLEFTRIFDQVDLANGISSITDKDLKEASNSLDRKVYEALVLSSKRIKQFHELQLPETISLAEEESQEISFVPSPIQKVGLYVPGGRAAYPSTVLMNAIPAKVAGVKEIILCTPPANNGRIPDSVLVAASISGVDKVFSVGGAHSIAAMAYGTQSIPKVDKIVGPGNAYVMEAKRLVSKIVSIDKDAGPSEIVVLIDKTTRLDWAVADMLAQAEHDPDAMAVAICLGKGLCEDLENELEKQMNLEKRKEVISKSLSSRGAIIQVDTFEDAIQVIDEIAPEHLQIMIEDIEKIDKSILNAGAIFSGIWSSAVFGDYIIGTNHVLPTGGSARFHSPLSVLDFIKWTNFVSFDQEYANSLLESAAVLAESEGLSAHARALRIRLAK